MSGSGAPNSVPGKHATTTINRILPGRDYRRFKPKMHTGLRLAPDTAAPGLPRRG